MRDDEARVLDIVEACGQLIEHVAGDPDRFGSDPVVQAAAQRWLEIIGEAAARLSDEFKRARPEIAWRDLVGMRNILAHGYFHVDLDVVWSTITRDVPELLDSLRPESQAPLRGGAPRGRSEGHRETPGHTG